MDFTIELAKSLIESTEDFPVDFESAWIWLGYRRKDNAVKTLKSYFVEGEDFAFRQSAEWNQAGRSKDLYLLTTNCLKEFGMIAKTQQGKRVRKYFLECERIAKQAVQLSKVETQPVLMPTSEQLDFMRSRSWERAELEGRRMTPEEIAAWSGFSEERLLPPLQ